MNKKVNGQVRKLVHGEGGQDGHLARTAPPVPPTPGQSARPQLASPGHIFALSARGCGKSNPGPAKSRRS